jgi:oligopeptide/dipeptide ABC transporter ATP-binding protein
MLDVVDLHTDLLLRGGTVHAVDGVSLTVGAGETLGVVGESGCGKSMLALSILRLVPTPPAKITGGRILFEGRDLLQLSEAEMRAIRGKDISMIFQEPMTSLNPVVTIGRQLGEAITLHQGLSRRDAAAKTIDMLRLVHIPEAERRVGDYPHQMSGGMRQRVVIAMALSCNPKVILADEPTTALDVTIQAQLLDLMAEMQAKFGTAMVLITHDMGLIAENADRVMVMYAGRKVEEAEVNALFAHPLHPYTRGLLGSIPHLETGGAAEGGRNRLQEIKGSVPSLQKLPPGCAFAERCPLAMAQCREAAPPLEQKRAGHWAACWHASAAAGGA